MLRITGEPDLFSDEIRAIVQEEIGNSEGGVSIYTEDGTLTGDREVNLGEHILTIRDGALSFIGGAPDNISFTVSNASGGLDYNGLSSASSRVVFSTPRFGIGAADPAYYFDVRGDNGHYFFIDTTLAEERTVLGAISSEDEGSNSLLTLGSSSEWGYLFNLSSRFDGNEVNIQGDATARTITLTAANGVIFPDLAGGGITGLSIDNDGKIIRTP